MTEPSTYARTELAQRSSDPPDVTPVWVHGDDADEAAVCVCHWREGAYFEIAVERDIALDAYCPFAYRAVHYEDSGVAT